MKVAVVAPIGAGITADPVWMSEFARHLEACGFESIVMAEHTVLVTRYTSVYPYDPSGRVDVAPGCPVPDPLEMLAWWDQEQGGIVLDNVQALREPVPCSGMLGLWTVPADIERAVRELAWPC